MAISLGDASNVTSGGSCVMNNACAVGDLIVVFGNTVQSGLVAAGASDNVNTGAYTAFYSQFNSGAGKQASCFYKVCNAVGTPTITNTGGAAGLGVAMRFTGFVSGVNLVPADQSAGWPTSSTTAVNSGSINASYNSELFIAFQASGQNNASGGTGWTSSGVFANTGIGGDYILNVSKGSATSYVATLNAADFPFVIIQGFIDGPLASNSAVLAWIT